MQLLYRPIAFRARSSSNKRIKFVFSFSFALNWMEKLMQAKVHCFTRPWTEPWVTLTIHQPKINITIDALDTQESFSHDVFGEKHTMSEWRDLFSNPHSLHRIHSSPLWAHLHAAEGSMSDSPFMNVFRFWLFPWQIDPHFDLLMRLVWWCQCCWEIWTIFKIF